MRGLRLKIVNKFELSKKRENSEPAVAATCKTTTQRKCHLKNHFLTFEFQNDKKPEVC
jgi:hypothetical protein